MAYITRRSPLFLVLSLSLAACTTDATGESATGSGTETETGNETGEDPEPPGSAASEIPRELMPDPGADALDSMRLGEWAFAQELYDELSATAFEPGDNLMLSPYSLRAAFGMSWGGAIEETETEMAEVLRFELGQDLTHESLNYIDLALAARNDAGDEDNPPVTVLTNNRFFLHFEQEVADTYLDLLAHNYGADVKLVDFRDGEPARLQMNQWVADQTQDRIDELLPKGSIQDLTPIGGTISVLINTLYLKAPWSEAFAENGTSEADFTTRSGATVSVPMMYHEVAEVRYGEVDGHVIVDLPLRRGELSMMMILPPSLDDPVLDSWLDPAALDSILASLTPTHAELRVPRFEIAGETLVLKPAFEALGMEAPFIGGFDAAYPDGGVFIDNIYHQVFFAIDEAGVEGAAATAIVNGLGFTPDVPPEAEYSVTFDRPFLAIVLDRATGTLLFMGRITNPGSS